MADHNATIAQTLPAITQAATGETDFFTAVGEATITNVVAGSFSQDTTHTVIITERTLYAEEWAESHVLNVTNTVEYDSSIIVDEVFYGTHAIPGISWTTRLFGRPLKASSRTSWSVTLPVTGSLTGDDSQEISISLTSLHNLTATSSVTVSGSYLVEYQSTLLVNNSVLAGPVEAVTSVLNATDTIIEAYRSSAYTASSTVTGTNTATANKETFEELLSTLTGTELITFDGSIASNTVEDTFYAKNVIWAKDFGALAWVLNTETGGLSTYDNYGFNSLAVYNGVLYATSNEGVMEFSSDTDTDLRSIVANVKTGFMDFEQENTKRISDIFLGHVGGQLEFAVETYDGPQEVYTYAIEEREIDAPRNNRLKVGRGLSSRYWRFAIQNVDGADFQIYDVTAEVASSKRRL